MRSGALDLARVRRALVVDDEGAVRGVLRRWFVRRGWTVTEATDGDGALQQLRLARQSPATADFDVIICDLRMPSLSGAELHAWAAEHCPDVTRRLVFASGDVLEPSAASFLRDCGCPVLEKPFELSQLEQVVSSLTPR